MAHFEVAVIEMEEWAQISGSGKWAKEFLWILPKDYPLLMPGETIRRIQIILELANQGVPVSEPQIAIRKMYHPQNVSLVAEMGGWFVIHIWPEGRIESSFQKLKVYKN